MSLLIKKMSDLNIHINAILKKSIEETAKTATNKLHDCINQQYYHDPEFFPNVYHRTYEFLNHVAFDMISNNCAQIYVDINGMHYKNNFRPWQVVAWASESKHGANYYQTNTEDFWTIFFDWCNNNLLNLLKANINKYGIRIK